MVVLMFMWPTYPHKPMPNELQTIVGVPSMVKIKDIDSFK